jgi:hypothetical protein
LHVTHRTLALVVIAAVLAAGWSALRAGEREIAVLRVFDGTGADVFATLWVVDDEAGFAWIRANRPDRRWLTIIERNPKVELRRQGRNRRYVAHVFDTPDARAYVAPRFRAKYGLADRWREWTSGRDTIPVRLERP